MATRRRAALKTNQDRLVEMSVIGQIAPPAHRGDWRVGPDGTPSILPGVGGITYNCKVGDSALDWAADHVEPAVTLQACDSKAEPGLNTLACIGNVARVVSGDARGAEGVVTGKHGGVEHVLVDFADEAMEQMAIGDRVQIRAYGVGLKLVDLPDIALMNMSPCLLDAMAPDLRDGALHVRVAHRVPEAIMGSGLGRAHSFRGDCDIEMFDDEAVRQYGLGSLRLGDLVAITDADHAFGRTYCTGAVSIGVVVHSCCATAGHGPGVTSLMSSRSGRIVPLDDSSANIARFLKIGRARPRRARRGRKG